MNELGAPDVLSINISPGATHGGCVFPAALYTIDFFNQFRNTTVPLDAITLEAKPRIFPNPAGSGTVTIAGLNRGDLSAHLFDAQGRLVSQYALPEGQRNLSLGDLAKGVYWLRITSGKQIYSEKIVIGR
jgi:hypothetical protein